MPKKWKKSNARRWNKKIKFKVTCRCLHSIHSRFYFLGSVRQKLVLHFTTSELRIFDTNEKAPYLIVAEVYDPFTLCNQKVKGKIEKELSKIIVEKRKSKKFSFDVKEKAFDQITMGSKGKV